MCSILIISILVFDCHEIDKLVRNRRQQPGCDYTHERVASPEKPDRLSERRCRQVETGRQSDRDRTFISRCYQALIFKYLHHEPVDFKISEPELDEVQGPLASANIALPWLIFFRRRDWLRAVK